MTRANLNAGRSTRQHYTNFFVQDTFTVGNRLTIRPGIRYEQQTLWSARMASDDFTLKNNWAPRIGATYDVLGNGRSKMFANWGRFFAKIPNDLAARALSADAGISRADYFDANLTQPIPEGVAITSRRRQAAMAQTTTQHFLLQGVGADLIDPNAKSSYVDEFVGGFEYEAFANVNLGVRYIHRTIPRVLEDIGSVSRRRVRLPRRRLQLRLHAHEPGPGTPVLTDLGATSRSRSTTTTPCSSRRTSASRTTGRCRRPTRWSRLHGTFEGFYREDNGQSDPGITSLYDFPTNDPSYTAIGGSRRSAILGDIRFLGALGAGPLPLDRPHVVKVFGNYVFNFGLNLGVGLTMNSGTPLTALASNPNYDERRRDSDDAARRRVPDDRRVQDADAVRVHRRPARRLRVQVRRQQPAGAAGGRVQPVQSAADDRLRQLRRARKGRRQPRLRAARVENVAGPQFQTPRQIRFGARFEF